MVNDTLYDSRPLLSERETRVAVPPGEVVVRFVTPKVPEHANRADPSPLQLRLAAGDEREIVYAPPAVDAATAAPAHAQQHGTARGH